MKYRIFVEKGSYYPQYRSYGFWYYFKYLDKDAARGVDGDTGKRVEVFKTEAEARAYIKDNETKIIDY